MDQQIIDLYDNFTHGRIDRRGFMEQATALTGSTAAAAAIIPMFASDYAKAASVPEGDSRLAIETLAYDSPSGQISGYLARPVAKGKRPAILVIHQNRGLNAHLKDVARRFAVEGFLAYAIDILSPVGGTPPTDDEARVAFEKVKPDEAALALAPAIPFLKSHPESTGKVGAVGFCWGGGMVNRVAMLQPALDAGVAYYGTVPPLDNVAAIKAPLLLHYAGNDAFVNPKVPGYEAALQANNKRYTIYHYEGTQHAFNDDTAGPRYDKAAADLAWGRTIAFFKENIGTPPNAA